MPQYHSFGSGSFMNELWVAQKKVFHDLKGIDVEFVSRGKWEWLIADSTGTIVKIISSTKKAGGYIGGWESLEPPHLGLYGSYSVGFRNASPGGKEIRGGSITYG